MKKLREIFLQSFAVDQRSSAPQLKVRAAIREMIKTCLKMLKSRW